MPVTPILPTGNTFVVPTYSDPAVGISDSGSWVASMIGFSVKLAVVLALIYGTIWILRRLMGRNVLSSPEARLITVMESTYLTSKQAIHIVSIGSEVIVVGATDGGIQKLHEIHDHELHDKLGRPETKSFQSILNDWVKAPKNWNPKTVAQAEGDLDEQ